MSQFWAKWNQSTLCHPIFHIIPPTTTISATQCLLFSRFPPKILYRVSAGNIPCPSHPYWFDNPNYIWRRYKSLSSSYQFSPPSCHFHRLGLILFFSTVSTKSSYEYLWKITADLCLFQRMKCQCLAWYLTFLIFARGCLYYKNSLICLNRITGEQKPTRCHLLFYCTPYRLNMLGAGRLE